MILKSNRGLAFIIVMVFLLAIALVAGTFVLLTSNEVRRVREQNNSTTAFYLAEAGAERAIALLEGNFIPDPPGEGQLFNLGEGRYEYEVFTTALPNQLRIVGRGYVPDEVNPNRVERGVELFMTRSSIFNVAVFGEERITMDSNAYTDSYDSDAGAYGGSNVGSNGDVGTNSIETSPPAISLDSNAEINGDATIGPGGDPNQAISIEDSAEITGTKLPAGSEKELPEAIAPTDLVDRGLINLDGNDTMTISEDGRYSSILLDSNCILTINADATIHITGELAVDSNSQLQIANGAEVTIFIDGELRVDSNAQINNLSQDPTALDIFGTDSLTNVSFDSNSAYYGTIYARQADVTLDSNINFYGSLIANSVSLDSNASIHYDEALGREAGAFDPPPAVSSWRELEFQELYLP